MYLFEPVGDVFTINALDKDGPLMGVVSIHPGGSGDGVESFSNAPIDLRVGCQKGICSLIHSRARVGDLRTEGSVDRNALYTRFRLGLGDLTLADKALSHGALIRGT